MKWAQLKVNGLSEIKNTDLRPIFSPKLDYTFSSLLLIYQNKNNTVGMLSVSVSAHRLHVLY